MVSWMACCAAGSPTSTSALAFPWCAPPPLPPFLPAGGPVRFLHIMYTCARSSSRFAPEMLAGSLSGQHPAIAEPDKHLLCAVLLSPVEQPAQQLAPEWRASVQYRLQADCCASRWVQVDTERLDLPRTAGLFYMLLLGEP